MSDQPARFTLVEPRLYNSIQSLNCPSSSRRPFVEMFAARNSLMTILPAGALEFRRSDQAPPVNALAPKSTMPCPAAHERLTVPCAGSAKPNRYGPAAEPETVAAACPLMRRSEASTFITGSENVTVQSTEPRLLSGAWTRLTTLICGAVLSMT